MSTAETQSSVPQPRRRWLQYRLRSLLLFVLVCAVPCSWVATRIQRANTQREAVEAMKRFPYTVVTYDYQVDASGGDLEGAELPHPAWLRRLLGDDFLASVYRVALTSDEGLEHIDCLTDLRELFLFGPGVTDDGLEHLEALPQLRLLVLAGTNVTDAGLTHIEGLTRLQELGLYKNRITDAGLAHLKALTQIERLSLEGTRLTDTGLAQLKDCTQLRALYLHGTGFTDWAADHLAGLTGLRYLEFVGTEVTSDGVEKIRKALPNCRIGDSR